MKTPETAPDVLAVTLKPCPNPWCEYPNGNGVAHNKREGFRVVCNCGIATPYFDTRAEAIAAWNTRARPSAPMEAAGGEGLREAFPKVIGRLHLGDRVSDGDRLCSSGHEVALGHPLYWPEMISQYDDSDPYCLLHAVELAESDAGWSDEEIIAAQSDAVGWAAVADQIIGQIEERFPNWRSYRDLIDCIDCTLHDLRSPAALQEPSPQPRQAEVELREALLTDVRDFLIKGYFGNLGSGQSRDNLRQRIDAAMTAPTIPTSEEG